jgi:hypothetical protein
MKNSVEDVNDVWAAVSFLLAPQSDILKISFLQVPDAPEPPDYEPYICFCKFNSFFEFASRLFFLSAASKGQFESEMRSYVVRTKFNGLPGCPIR